MSKRQSEPEDPLPAPSTTRNLLPRVYANRSTSRSLTNSRATSPSGSQPPAAGGEPPFQAEQVATRPEAGPSDAHSVSDMRSSKRRKLDSLGKGKRKINEDDCDRELDGIDIVERDDQMEVDQLAAEKAEVTTEHQALDPARNWDERERRHSRQDVEPCSSNAADPLGIGEPQASLNGSQTELDISVGLREDHEGQNSSHAVSPSDSDNAASLELSEPSAPLNEPPIIPKVAITSPPTVTSLGVSRSLHPTVESLATSPESPTAISSATSVPVEDLGAGQPELSELTLSKSPDPPPAPLSSERELELLSAYTCPICFSPPVNATLTPCGHICCGACLFTAVQTMMQRSVMSSTADGGARCPVCRALIPGWDGGGGGVIGLKIRAVISLQ